MKYLTRSYVEALDLPVMPYFVNDRNMVWVSERCLYPRSAHQTRLGVEFEGALYLREEDGLAFARARDDSGSSAS